MSKMLVGVFDRESSAFEALAALRDLHRDGDITVYSVAVIAKAEGGRVEIKQEADAGPVGTAVGLLSGSLVGLVGGPVGLAIGATFGSLTGLLVDANRSGVDLNFVDDVALGLTAGTTAVVAEIEESWTTPVDTRFRQLGGTVFRRMRGEVIEDQLIRESASLQADLKALHHELNQAAADNREAVKQDIARVKSQLEATQSRAKTRLDEIKLENEARVKTLEDQAKTARGLAKARIEKRLADVKSNLAARSYKLQQA